MPAASRSPRSSRALVRAALLVAVPAASTLALAACSPAAGAPETTAPVTETAAPADTVAGSCIVGDWRIADDQVQAYYDAVNASMAGVATFDPTGSSGLSFGADGTYRYTPDLTLAVDVSGVTGELALAGSIDGTYELVDGVLQPSEQFTNDLVVTGTLGGQPVDGEQVAAQIANAPLAAAPVDCSGPTPVVAFSTGAGTASIVLTR
ncbi:hypothetical protein ACDF64_06710 [Agromyces sp. MMS24-JH15]|uniref:hypothetical protein n=1 Tax=Agromyces sp. MMS24-JH15 TaxID=3243765 RepID=UPI0037498932